MVKCLKSEHCKPPVLSTTHSHRALRRLVFVCSVFAFREKQAHNQQHQHTATTITTTRSSMTYPQSTQDIRWAITRGVRHVVNCSASNCKAPSNGCDNILCVTTRSLTRRCSRHIHQCRILNTLTCNSCNTCQLVQIAYRTQWRVQSMQRNTPCNLQ